MGGRSQRLSKIVTEMADYMINLSVLKNHGIAGATLCLKNHYGTCDKPGDLHSRHADPYIGALNALDPIQKKQCLSDTVFPAPRGPTTPVKCLPSARSIRAYMNRFRG